MFHCFGFEFVEATREITMCSDKSPESSQLSNLLSRQNEHKVIGKSVHVSANRLVQRLGTNLVKCGWTAINRPGKNACRNQCMPIARALLLYREVPEPRDTIADERK
jgi:hypothetical protein